MTSLLCMGNNVFKALSQSDEADLVRFKAGDVMTVKPIKVRNPLFHRKFFALLNLAYDAFEPVAEYKGEVIKKNFEKFRSDVTILAGYYDMTVGLKGEAIAVAKSISFSSMDESEFEKLYSNVADVILQRVLTNYTKDDLDAVIEKLVGFL